MLLGGWDPFPPSSPPKKRVGVRLWPFPLYLGKASPRERRLRSFPLSCVLVFPPNPHIRLVKGCVLRRWWYGASCPKSPNRLQRGGSRKSVSVTRRTSNATQNGKMIGRFVWMVASCESSQPARRIPLQEWIARFSGETVAVNSVRSPYMRNPKSRNVKLHRRGFLLTLPGDFQWTRRCGLC